MVTGFASEDEMDDSNLKKYVALRMCDILKKPSVNETLIKIGAYVLLEFGSMITQEKTI